MKILPLENLVNNNISHDNLDNNNENNYRLFEISEEVSFRFRNKEMYKFLDKVLYISISETDLKKYVHKHLGSTNFSLPISIYLPLPVEGPVLFRDVKEIDFLVAENPFFVFNKKTSGLSVNRKIKNKPFYVRFNNYLNNLFPN